MRTCATGPKRQKEYPKLMIQETSGAIVLFSRDSEGTVVHGKSTGGMSVGESRASWRMVKFSPYIGTVTLIGE